MRASLYTRRKDRALFGERRAALLKKGNLEGQDERRSAEERGPQRPQTMDAYEKLEKIGEGVSVEGGHYPRPGCLFCLFHLMSAYF